MRVLQITVFSILFMSTRAFINMLLLKNTNAAVVNASLGFFFEEVFHRKRYRNVGKRGYSRS